MKLSNVHIENFRSLKNIDIDFNKSAYFVGKNNSGKSNVLKALDLVLGEGYYRLSNNDFFNQDDTLTIKINIYFDSFTQVEIDGIKSNIIYPVTFEGIRYIPDEIKQELEEKRNIHVETEIIGKNIDRRLYIGDIYYRYFSNELKNAIVNTIYIPSVRDTDEMTSMYRNSILNKLLKLVYEACEQRKKDELIGSLNVVTDKLDSIFSDCEIRLNEISNEIISHQGIKMSILSSEKDVYKKLHILLDDGVESELEHKGTGIQSVIIISLFKLYSELKSASTILLIEEPESFLHPHAHRHMSSILDAIARDENTQLIITTHSPNIILNANIKNIVLFTKNGIESKIKQIQSVINEIKLKKELNPDNLELFFSDKVILVEGSTEKMLLPKIAKLINIQNDFDKKNISIIEIGSKSNLETFISLLNNFNVNWLALVDRDFASKTESLALMKKLNDSFDYRLNIDATGEIDLIQQFKTKNIYVLEHGEIENYYSIIWLSGIITSEIEDLTLNPADEDYVKRNFDTINNTTVIGTFKQGFFTGKAFESYNQYVLNKLINIKFKLLTLNLDQNKVSKELELIFNEIDLSKPRIAIKLLPYMQIVDMPAHKRTDLEGFINKIFL